MLPKARSFTDWLKAVIDASAIIVQFDREGGEICESRAREDFRETEEKLSVIVETLIASLLSTQLFLVLEVLRWVGPGGAFLVELFKSPLYGVYLVICWCI